MVASAPPWGAQLGYDAFISYSHSADGELAPAIRDGLQRFAKKWNRRRALSVFLDQASLEVSAGLKDSLQAKLADTEWLILLLSEESAGSRWVTEEITHWLEDKPKERIALVQTSGEIAWDGDADDFDMEASTSVPEGLRGVYSGQGSEPLWLDLRWAAHPHDEDLDLRHTRFRDAIATLAAPIHGKPKDELEGEDVRQHRRLVRLRRAAIVSLTLLTIAASVAGVLALLNAQRARAEARTATARLLAGQSREAFRADQAVLVALEAMRIEPNVEATGSLLDAVRRGAHAIAYLHDGPSPIGTAAVHRRFDLVATGGRDGTFAVWHIGADGASSPATQVQAETGTEGLVAVGQIAFHSVEPVLYTVGTDLDVKAWDVADLEDIRLLSAVVIPFVGELAFSRNFVSSMTVSPRGDLLAIGGEGDNAFTLWDVSDAGTPQPLGAHRMRALDTPSAIAFDEAGTLLAVGTGSGFELWDVARPDSPEFLVATEVESASTTTTALAFVPLVPELAWGGAGGGIQVWDVSTPTQPEAVVSETGDGLTSLSFTTEAGLVLIGRADGQIVTWDISAAGGPTPVALLAGHGGAVLAAEVVAGGRYIVSAEEDGTVVVWDAAGTRGPGVLGLPLEGAPTHVSFTPDGGGFWTVTDRGRIDGWEPAPDGPQLVAELGADGPVGDYNVAAAGGLVAVATNATLAGDEGTVIVWDAGTGERRWTLPIAGVTGESVALTDDGGLLAVGTALPGATLLWDLAADALEPITLPLPDDETIVAALEFESTEGLLAEGSGSLAGGSLRLWDVSDPAAPATVYEDFEVPGLVLDVAFGPLGQQLVAGTVDGSLIWWDLFRDTAQREGGPVAAHGGAVQAVAFSPDGATVVSAGDDGRILMWDADSRTRIAEFADFTQPVTGLAFQPEGGNLISAARGFPQGFVAWELDPAEWRRAGCAFTNRSMTDEEWARYAGADEPYVAHCHIAAGSGVG